MYAISITDPKPSHPYPSIILYGRGEWNRTTIKRVKVFRLAIGLRPYHGGERGIRTLGAFILYRLATCCLTHSAISPNNLAGKAGIEPTSSRLTAVSFARLSYFPVKLKWSGWLDLNQRLRAPKARVLAGWTTSRNENNSNFGAPDRIRTDDDVAENHAA